MVRDLNLQLETPRPPDRARRGRPRAVVAQRPPLAEERQRALALPRALATQDPERARELLDGLDVDYVEVADFEPRVLAAAVRVGDTRLIDNVPLEGEPA